MSFKKAMIAVRQAEGGYVNDPDDPGRETYCGISRRFFPKWPGWSYIDRKKKAAGTIPTNYKFRDRRMYEMIDAFYYSYFWKPLKCDQIDNDTISEHLFDCGINLGKKSAVRFFQKACNIYEASGLKVDGVIGPKTLNEINYLTVTVKNDRNFVNFLVQERIQLYFEKCYESPIKFKWLKGWILRSLKYLKK